MEAVEGVTDEARHKMFRVPADKVLKVTCRQEPCAYDDKKGNPDGLDPNRQVDGQPNIAYEKIDPRSIPQDGRVRLAVNGIFNNEQRAAELAMQNTPVIEDAEGNKIKPNDLYVVYYPKANNPLSELLVAGYEKFMAPTFGYTNPTWLTAEVLNQQGANNVLLEGHSRGALVVNNALTLLGEQGYKNPSLSVNVYGPAVGEGRVKDSFFSVTGNRDDKNLGYIYDTRDPVATFTGGAQDSSYAGSLAELWNVIWSNNSAHSCYGTGAPGCKPFQGPVSGTGGNP